MLLAPGAAAVTAASAAATAATVAAATFATNYEQEMKRQRLRMEKLKAATKNNKNVSFYQLWA